ncbi:hypothetical protein D9619_004510 [Psilocybe cf. subviscida]|uniref:Coiled-coil domain-containing protein 16 n=1 Tax=Psilocybe cf. subviscida TaxID=2480587 RepID=A0A8H5BR50_9AGAR|nr:hypothetical protein D9619_004510 [Psilocybe cf. subviscida]
MADVRALLKAKRQEARITHPYASYTTAGQLKCTVCSTPVKHASAWEGHLGSKVHRTNVIRMREEEERQRQVAALQKAREEDEAMDEDADGDDDDEEERADLPPGKRRAPVDEDEGAGNHAEKKRKVEASQSSAPGGFPQDFFSDPLRGPILLPEDDEEDEGDTAGAADASTSQAAATAAPGAPKNEVDLEYERFQHELLATTAAAASSDKRDAFERATVFAEPIAASTDIEGFPPVNAPDSAEAAPQELTGEELRQKKEQEDRELIMDRLLEEERAQEDADTKVQMLKNRIEALRKKREQAKAKKATASSKAS